jgi:predicted O-methyltransferase YrrM
MFSSKKTAQRLYSFLKFLFHSNGIKGFGIHSPFAFQFVTEVIRPFKAEISDLQLVDSIREKNSHDNRVLSVIDFGTSKWKKPYRVKDILKRSVSNRKKSRILFQVAKFLNPDYIVELGTSLGITAITFSLASPHSRILTVEGSPEIAEIARENFTLAGLTNIEIRIGRFEDELPRLAAEISSPFLAYIDGNHCYSATINYFTIFIDKLDSQSCIIIDDIHWSNEMEKAWEEICSHAKSTICLDFYYFGIIFYRERTAKTRYNIRLSLF